MENSSEILTILSLLNNAKDLLWHSDRQNSKQVLKAVKIYAEENGIPFDDNKFSNFHRVLIDSRKETLIDIVNSIALDFIQYEKSKNSKNKLKRKLGGQ